MEFFHQILLVFHFVGLAAVVGGFLVQLSNKSGFNFRWLIIGAVIQLVSGLGMVGVLEMTDSEVNHFKIGIKLLFALITLVAVLIARAKQKKALAQNQSDRVALPWLHITGAAALINILVAVLWR